MTNLIIKINALQNPTLCTTLYRLAHIEQLATAI